MDALGLRLPGIKMSLFDMLGYASPVLMTLLVAGAIIHACRTPGNIAPGNAPLTWKVIVLCVSHGLIAAEVYWHLINGGWLSAHYHWDDPDNINLVMAVFEALAALVTVALLVFRRRFLYRLLIDLMLIQLLLAVVMAGLVLLFVLTWKPKIF